VTVLSLPTGRRLASPGPGKDTVAATQITYLSAGAMYFDDFYVIDITDRVDLDATSLRFPV
jgi:hypothetical protein